MRRLDSPSRNHVAWYVRHAYGIGITILVFVILILLAAVATVILAGLNNKYAREIKSDLDDDDGGSSSGSGSSSSGGRWRDYCSVKNTNFQHLRFCDTFNGAQGIFNPNNTCPYFYFNDPTIPFTADDGNVQSLNGRIKLNANPFTLTVPQGPTGTLDHTKSLVFATIPTSVGAGQTISFYSKSSCQTFGVQNNPFPSYLVADAKADMRLASCAINFVDFNLFMVFDFLLTEDSIHCLYERLAFGRTAQNNYRAFTSIKKAGNRKSAYDIEDLSFEYDRPLNEVRWLRDGKVVCSVTDIGTPSDDFRIILDLGGDNEVVDPTSFSPGFGLFTLLDMLDPNNKTSNEGLVRLVSGIPNFYVNPTVFYDEASMESNRLFGQGASMSLYQLKVVVSDEDVTESKSGSGKHKRDIFDMSEKQTLVSRNLVDWNDRFVNQDNTKVEEKREVLVAPAA